MWFSHIFFSLLRWDFFCYSHLFNLGVPCLCLENGLNITALQNRYFLDCNRCPPKLGNGKWIGFSVSSNCRPVFLDQCRLCADSSSFLLPTFSVQFWTALPAHYSRFSGSFQCNTTASCPPGEREKICSSTRCVSCSNANSYPQGSERIPISVSVFVSWYPHLVRNIWLSSVMWQIKYLAFFFPWYFFHKEAQNVPPFSGHQDTTLTAAMWWLLTTK